MSRKRERRDRPDPRHFVQVAVDPSRGVETSSGRAWVGVDQQVGHGSADALFALTPRQYADGLADAWPLRPFMAECWQGGHDDLRMFDPRGGAWKPAAWSPHRSRMLRTPFEGELWWHVDALGVPVDDPRARVARALAGDTDPDDPGAAPKRTATFALVGEDAYPRPAALVAGLDAGVGRDQVRAVLGAPAATEPDSWEIDGATLHARYDGDALVALELSRRPEPGAPAGVLGVLLAAPGRPEQGAEYLAVAALADGERRRWASGSGHGRRLLAWEDGVEMQGEGGTIHGVRVDLTTATAPALAALARATRPELHVALGVPVGVSGPRELHQLAGCDVVVGYADVDPQARATDLGVVVRGRGLAVRFLRWRSGGLTTFLDVLGLRDDHPLVAHVRGLPGVRLDLRRGEVVAVRLTDAPERLLDGMPQRPRRADVPLGRPRTSSRTDDTWRFDQGWVRVRSRDGETISEVVVTTEEPRA
ncbi:hypothetical protein RDV89_02520 [Nocardioides zeae]|uniref:Phage tail protein n=1 Tax=Nocardioides imazamoxiresistens TaxID=3231893 RepID=A0ABU3PRS0_9ACTN|nr:hypothetical protein [Nocardioides zeae]MDT9591925.1 hypothetical protein [Nocardioides zeae]